MRIGLPSRRCGFSRSRGSTGDRAVDALKEAARSPEGCPWYRAIYVDEVPVGFLMLGLDAPPGDERYRFRYFLWKWTCRSMTPGLRHRRLDARPVHSRRPAARAARSCAACCAPAAGCCSSSTCARTTRSSRAGRTGWSAAERQDGLGCHCNRSGARRDSRRRLRGDAARSNDDAEGPEVRPAADPRPRRLAVTDSSCRTTYRLRRRFSTALYSLAMSSLLETTLSKAVTTGAIVRSPLGLRRPDTRHIQRDRRRGCGHDAPPGCPATHTRGDELAAAGYRGPRHRRRYERRGAVD